MIVNTRKVKYKILLNGDLRSFIGVKFFLCLNDFMISVKVAQKR